MDIVFVMLHYMAIEETKISIDYIRKNVDTEKYKIIVVDNASPDNSGDMLIKEYGQDIDIKIIKARTNLGFARGNNLGFRYAKKCWNPKYIVLMNNDVYLIEKKLMYKLEIEYSKSRFDVLGPMIMTGDGRCDINPQKSEFKNVEDVKKRIVKEVQQAKLLLEKIKKELKDEKIPFNEEIQIGVMIETPAAVMISGELAREADFFSIGTNDLTQLTLGMDRTNSKLDHFYNPHHPALLKMIRIIANNVHLEGKTISICGDLAADLDMTEQFLQMGIDELSVAPNQVLALRKKIREIQ